MYLQNMSEKIARPVRSTLQRETALRVLRGKRLKSFSVQDVYGCASPQRRKLSPLQRPLVCLAIRALPHSTDPVQFRHPVAYSFSGANFL
jgi:hypothetical protein